MNLYEVIRWGNDDSDEGPNGKDTCFLVRAATVSAAAALTDAMLRGMPHHYVVPHAQQIYHIGFDAGVEQKETVLRGPYQQSAYCHGWRQWSRDSVDGTWVETAK